MVRREREGEGGDTMTVVKCLSGILGSAGWWLVDLVVVSLGWKYGVGVLDGWSWYGWFVGDVQKSG